MKQLSGLDASFLYMETPTSMGHVSGIGVYQRPPQDFAPWVNEGDATKAGQSVPAGVGQPTLLIDGLTVGGTAA